VEQLLTHTSGIRSYTDMPSWREKMREDWTLPRLLAFFRDEPFDFEPGTRWHYDNSGYVLLGAILEKVSGKSYGQLLDETILQPLGLTHTRYGDDAPIIPGRVAGYQRTGAGTVNAPYLSMTQPYAAGGLVSTVDDLARWQAALDRGDLLSAESRRRMWTPVVLPDGTPTRYGFGWGIWNYRGHAVVEHGGSINGFTCANMRWPDDRVYVAVLSNVGGGPDPRSLAFRAATVLLGEPADDRKPAAASTEALDRLTGTFRDSDGDDWTVRRDGDHLVVAAGPRTWAAYAETPDAREFFLKDAVRWLRFERDSNGNVSTLVIDDQIGPAEKAKRIGG
jgi:D-alanyl-D-alanine carboxypeptidase